MSAPASASAGSKRSSSALGSAASSRNVRPLHFHAGPNPTAAALAEAAAQSALIPRVELYRHALECVFRFLRLSDLHTVLSVSKGWKAAVKSMGSVEQAVTIPDNVSALGTMVSSLARHIGYLDSTVAHSAVLYLTAEKLTSLRRWICYIACPLSEPIRWPSSLRELNLTPGSFPAEPINRLLAAMMHLRSLESLEICFHRSDSELNFAPLQLIPSLRCLACIFRRDKEPLTDAQVAQIRGLTQLRSLDTSSPSALARILLPPHALPWTKLGESLCPTLTDAVSAVLPSLAFLETLNARVQTVSQLDCFQSMHALNSATLIFNGCGTPEAVLAEGLKHAVQLTSLSLGWCTFTNEHLTTITASLHRLEQLKLSRLSQLDGLGFLTAAGSTLSSTLQGFVLRDCPLMPSAELVHVHSMRKLRMLWLNQPLDPLCLALYRQRPCALIPTLETFHNE